MTKGTVNVYRALNDKFNFEFTGAILGYIDEKVLNKKAYLTVKEMLDGEKITIRAMRTNACEIDSYLHIVHASNTRLAVPVEYGDERVVFIEAETITQDDLIPWDDTNGEVGFKSRLMAEASDFLAALLNYPLPPSSGRLYLPPLCTPAKREVMEKDLEAEGLNPADHRQSLPQAIDEWLEDEMQVSSEALIRKLGPGDWPLKANPFTRELRKARDTLRDDHRIELTLESERPGKRGGHALRRMK